MKENDAFNYFELKSEHIKLLSKVWVSWDFGEFGAPAIDCKRPYGNSFVYGDIAEILGLTPRVNEFSEEYFSEEQKAFMDLIHCETKTALQVILSTQSFRPGLYKCEKYSIDWKYEDENS